ncbi:hypothetical protein B7495_02340 [Cryobacterium sp. LW097]|uniref:hypothetical protein n=1 Tax=unclassified Cryobacterium TaxID=2649013 RepID=UPI000B4DE31B|nr:MULTISPECIES: hypothetical protein [unclassified Cryobacterium]ASD21075.1 hypothetical protein B7495_02340 [Cryobacterium sp. LW097]TFC61651.1 hypothetical protein E3O60_03625 [Cryobacterium sp. TMB1-7]TFC92003.1 hypothetical protein E3T19_02915 [Cryobacterium sp. TMT4-31]
MTAHRATQQRLDPLGTLAAWPLSPAIASIVLCYSVIATVLQQDQIRNPLMATLAVLAMAAAAATLVIGTQPARSPFGRRIHLIMAGFALLGYVCEQLSRWGDNLLVQDDFGPVCIGFLLLALAPYRPWREIALSGAVASVVAILITVPQAGSYEVHVPVAVYAIVSVTQILAPTAAGAAYSRRIVRSILAWQTDARRAIVARTEEARGQMARAVVEQQVSALKSGVIPFLAELLERGTVTALDVAQAGQLAAEVRRTLVAEIDRTWLDSVATRERAALAERGTPGLLVVADPEHRATAFRAEQRAATAALIGALCAAPGFDPHSLVVQITGSSTPTPPRPAPATLTAPRPTLTKTAPPTSVAVDTITIQAALDLPPRKVRALLRPYLGVIRVVFANVRVTVRRPSLTIEFDGARDPHQVGPPREALATPATPAGVRAKQPPRQVR